MYIIHPSIHTYRYLCAVPEALPRGGRRGAGARISGAALPLLRADVRRDRAANSVAGRRRAAGKIFYTDVCSEAGLIL